MKKIVNQDQKEKSTHARLWSALDDSSDKDGGVSGREEKGGKISWRGDGVIG